MRHSKLTSTFRYILSASLPLAGIAVACGGTSASDANGDGGVDAAADNLVSNVDQCGKCGCGTPPAPATHTVQWTPNCNAITNDGGMEAGDDASDDASSDADAAADLTPMQCLARKCDQLCVVTGAVGNIQANCKVLSESGGTQSVECSYFRICGRRPAGLEAVPDPCDVGAVGRYLAGSAYLEAASVDAFAILADDLRAHGAPARLVRAARRAARDEIRHARVMTALASRAGARPEPVKSAKRTQRSLEAIAIENAQEGCVRETYGALLATWQARAAGDARVRAAMRGIARDETRHAELSWDIARWAETRLSRAAKARVDKARRAAAEALVVELASEPTTDLVELLGLPRADHALATARAMDALLWRRAA